MSDRLLVGTGKGLFMWRRDGTGVWRQDAVHFLGAPVSMAMADPRNGTLYAALGRGRGVRLWRRRLRDPDWNGCALPVYPPQLVSGAGPGGLALQRIWSIEAGGADQPGVLWAGTMPGGLFRSADGGGTWVLNQPLWGRPERRAWAGHGCEVPGIHSICVDPHDSRHVTIAVSCGGVWQTRDGGLGWICTISGMAAAQDEHGVHQDPLRMAQCAGHAHAIWVQHRGGMYRSGDAGVTWQRLSARPSSFGLAVAAHPRRPNTAWFVPLAADNCRVPVEGRLVVNRTRDGGRSFEACDDGLPEAPVYDMVDRHGLAVDAGGERLAMGSTTGNLWLSENGGDRWKLLTAHLPPVHCLRFF
ncbi:exo-alpha-sialidase [Cupriavidus sp. 2TAF22]|uniref:WD40/YVTN/BNR-like repeat-containing protein n=1 Tax=unclassified Cupriavidus TaxID=2640874 RepID=UPI003F913AB6